MSPFPAGRPADRLSTSGLARDARGAVFALPDSSGGALRPDTGPKETDRCIGLTPLSTAASRASRSRDPRSTLVGVGLAAAPCRPSCTSPPPCGAPRRQAPRAVFAGAARSPRGRCLVGAAAAVAPACGELTAGSLWLLLLRGCSSPRPRPSTGRLLLHRAVMCRTRRAGSALQWAARPGLVVDVHRDGAPRAPSTGKRRPPGADSRRSAQPKFVHLSMHTFQWPTAAFEHDRRLPYDPEHCARP